jgi:hypothetical protein
MPLELIILGFFNVYGYKLAINLHCKKKRNLKRVLTSECGPFCDSAIVGCLAGQGLFQTRWSCTNVSDDFFLLMRLYLFIL